MTRRVLSRRTVLRGLVGGAAVAVGLPLLETMSPPLVWAAPEAPRRFGVWFWGNGVRRAHWIPTSTAPDWQAPEELLPLMGVRPYVSVVTGLEIKTATHPHHSGMAGILTGAAYQQVGTTRDTIVSTFAYPSVDQVAAAALGGQTPYRSLELAVCAFRGTDEGTTFQYLSHNGPNNVNPSEYSPATLFKRLFGALPSPQVSRARRSVLDAVAGQVQRLSGTVSAHDRIRLDQHLSSIRAIEKRLQSEAMACEAPPGAVDLPDVMGREQIAEKNRAMSDLLAVALSCDLSRVFSVMFSTAGSGVVVWPAGATNSLHQICHDEAAPQPTVHRSIVFTMEQLAYFLQRLRDTPEAGGNLLDHASILCTTELSEGNTHSNDEFPVLIAGKAGGRLRGGVHYRSTGKENASLAPFTALRAAGVPLTKFGYGPGEVSSTLKAIEV